MIANAAMKLLSLNTGLPREVRWNGELVQTAIFKSPVQDRISLRKFNLDGDRQADLTVHGGEHKAVYCYPFATMPSGSRSSTVPIFPWVPSAKTSPSKIRR